MKRGFDIVASAAGLVLTLPLYPLIALAIKLDSAGPVFYVQERVGLRGELFKILKFRTMVRKADRHRSLTTRADARITRVGRWLRRFEIDELPTLINVIKGDMSIVGPRPELSRYVELYTPEQRRVLEVRPGMTDLGTLRFRDETSQIPTGQEFERLYVERVLPKKLQLNLEYLTRRSFLFDLRLVFETLFLVVRRGK